VAIAPYVMWSALSALTAVIALARRALPFPIASTLFVWCFAVPLGDIANAGFPWAINPRDTNDLTVALGPPTAPALAAAALATFLGAGVGYGVQRRLYGDAALTGVAYLTALAGLAGLAWCLVALRTLG
jgi:hypothetical protein